MHKTNRSYQYGFSKINQSMFHSEERLNKARKSIAVLNDHLASIGRSAHELDMLDIGCSTGYLTGYYGLFFRRVIGVDFDKHAILHASKNNSAANVSFTCGDAMNFSFPSRSFDAVTCTHIYEHVPDAGRMMQEIHRVLKNDGFCYFAAGNRLSLMEAHYHLPLLSVLPKGLAHRYIRLAGRADYYYETHLTLWGLRNLVKDFTIVDYTRKIIRDPAKYAATELITPESWTQKISLLTLSVAYWLCPTYIWILQKKEHAA